MKHLAIISIILSLGSTLCAQGLLNSRHTSYYTYIYRLDEKEARQIYRRDLWEVEPSFFHTLVDSFPTGTAYAGDLEQGYYLKVFTEENKLKLHITMVTDFGVLLATNNTDLTIRVYDAEGEVIEDADVRARWKHVRFDRKTRSYIDRRSNQQGLLSVTVDGFTALYNLERQYNNSLALRTARTVLYRTPVKCVWRPVNFVIHLPIDLGKSLYHGYPHGTISSTGWFFRRLGNRIACIFDPYSCNRSYRGYMVFSKPKYMPGDTVKLKAFVVKENGKPIDEPADLVIQTRQGRVKLATIRPYRDGGFHYQFPLEDSLELVLDRDYRVWLKKKSGRRYITGTFRYEDYELTSLRLELTADADLHYRGEDMLVHVSGKDDNDLNVLDGRLRVLVRPEEVYTIFSNGVYLPDTLIYREMDLEQDGDTEIVIPDSILPEMNFTYSVEVELLTSDNETMQESKRVDFYHHLFELEHEIVGDSLQVNARNNGMDTVLMATITGEDNFGNETELECSPLPLKFPLNPYYRYINITAGELQKTIDISRLPAMLRCFSERDRDSIRIQVQNPRNLSFSYFIYRRNAEKERGYGDSLAVEMGASSKQNFYLSIQYLWGGRLVDEHFRIPLREDILHVSVNEPSKIFPSQEVEIEVTVTDVDGEPVEGADLTAYGKTGKFGYTSPAMPGFEKQRKSKKVINSFSFGDPADENFPGLQLDYPAWAEKAGLDSIAYYRFLYPGQRIYRYEYRPANGITQFAPFVVSDGAVVPVHVIFVDHTPVYFGFSTNREPYSFQVSPGFHDLKIRTSVATFSIEHVYFKAGMKTILSLDDKTVNPRVVRQSAGYKLSDYEKRVLYRYVFPYRNTFGETPAYIEQHGRYFLLTPLNGQVRNYAGPVFGTDLTFEKPDGYSIDFAHEPFYEYEMSKGLLKMRSQDSKYYPEYLWMNTHTMGFSDEVLNRRTILKMWDDIQDMRRRASARYPFPATTEPGKGRVVIDLPGNYPGEPVNTLLFKDDETDFTRIYPGPANTFENLSSGYYSALYFLPDSGYVKYDSLYAGINGTTYYLPGEAVEIRNDSFGNFVDDLIREHITSPVSPTYTDLYEKPVLLNTYRREFIPPGTGKWVEGVVYGEDGMLIPGVTVLEKGTDNGTVTDFEGTYTLRVSNNHAELQYSFVGFETKEIFVGNQERIDVTLEESAVALDEVVVIGYGTRMKRELTASVVTVETSTISMPGVDAGVMNALQGRVAGVQVVSMSGVPGAIPDIRIRGMGTLDFATAPLIVIDGMIFRGDLSELDPSLVRQMQVLKGSEAAAIYGAAGANGVLIINSGDHSFETLGSEPDQAPGEDLFFPEGMPGSDIRENFSDEAFWEPELRTDENGRAIFKVKFPDDITLWSTHYLVMNRKRQAGKTAGQIMSYKPLMARLSMPRFLVEGDSVNMIGKVQNYTPVPQNLQATFKIDGKVVFDTARNCDQALIDTLPVTVSGSDSIELSYIIETPIGYRDGEKRMLQVFPAGLEETEGTFHVLENDTVIELTAGSAGDYMIHARADVLDVLDVEISRLINYRYNCNEQMASKLKALLAEQMICRFRGKEFRKKIMVKRMIRLLNRNRGDNGLWGWWNRSTHTSMWISVHILEAMVKAEQMGYRVDIETGKIIDRLVWELEKDSPTDSRVRMLKMLALLGADLDYNYYFDKLKIPERDHVNRFFRYLEVRQLCGLHVNIDTVDDFRKETMFGNIFFTGDQEGYYLLAGDVQNTLTAYRILKADNTADHSETLMKIRNYLFEKRSGGCWLNTYETARIIETILPDMLGDDLEVVMPELGISSSIDKRVTEFPFDTILHAGERIRIRKQGDFPVYLTSYRRHWNREPEVKRSDFEIETRFKGQEDQVLEAGKKVRMVVDVKVKKDADYVMITVPVPAGCSYGDKSLRTYHEVHREHFRNETAIFCERLTEGDYTFEIELVPRYNGKFTLNPAKIEMMYFPVFNANNRLKRVRIE